MNDLKNFLKVNQLVQIELLKETGESTRYSSRVEDLGENRIVLVAPMKERQPMILAHGTPLNIWFWDNQAVYVFRTYLLKNTMTSVQQITVAKPETIERVQQRDYVRVNQVMDVLLAYFNSKGEEEVIRCKSKDISGGGLMLVLNTYVPLKNGYKVHLQFTLEQTLIKAAAVIVWNEWELDEQGIENNLVGVKFIHIAENNRKIIIKNVYARQIELKRKGLL